MLFLKSTFTPNAIQTNCETYGLREQIIRGTVQKLLNNNSILITGTRGIGKTSLQYQLQQILNGNTTLLSRCGIDWSLPKYFTFFYECSCGDTVENIFSNILKQLINYIKEDKKIEIKSAKIEANLGIFKMSAEGSPYNSNKEQRLIDSFVDCLIEYENMYERPRINIAIDEVDQINPDYQISHFIKVLIETINRKGLDFISFILSGQDSVNEILLKQQPSFFRLVAHFVLEPLDEESTRSVFEECLLRLERPVDIDEWGLTLLVKLSNGHPHLIQILGDEALMSMSQHSHDNECNLKIVRSDCLAAVVKCLKSNGRRYDSQWSSLTQDERNLLEILIYNVDDYEKSQSDVFWGLIDSKTPKWRQEKIAEVYQKTYNDKTVDEILQILRKLCNKQILRYWHGTSTERRISGMYSFDDEMFRIYLSVDQDILAALSY